MLLHPLRQRSFPAWVGIFAILIISIAPALSQMLVHRAHGEAQPQKFNASTVQEHQHHAAHGMYGANHGAPNRPAAIVGHEACGYCVLFFYTPVLFAVDGMTITVKRYLSHLRIAAAPSSVILTERFASAIPRAPPY